MSCMKNVWQPSVTTERLESQQYKNQEDKTSRSGKMVEKTTKEPLEECCRRRTSWPRHTLGRTILPLNHPTIIASNPSSHPIITTNASLKYPKKAIATLGLVQIGVGVIFIICGIIELVYLTRGNLTSLGYGIWCGVMLIFTTSKLILTKSIFPYIYNKEH
ncbi:hypothetical protein HELRODRAFT_165470 [Helobdella robusta]|uniref:Uncharacterized protein n=1 Tax=Helobdella robusta TaxID=6412 RepID=T1EWV1_HELRO|nr:hypothetical protein HELRODRAFT_165470 [Helobdella robusta]ESN91436.1 hypothetical protein HELRODRAFT_165470 [Helobdella robusta]